MRGFWLGAALLLAAAPAYGQGLDGGAQVDAGALPPEPGGPLEAPPPAPAALPAEPLPMAPLAATQLGGYGELTFNRPSAGDPVLDLRRFVLFVGHTFDAHWRVYSEFEVEHAVASADDRGEAELEQAYVDYLHTDALNVRAGLVLMPVGIINQQHEPPTFNGVDRPLVDELVIPSTWREPGLGVWGRLGDDVRYQLYLVDGMRALGFGEAGSIREGHQEAQLALARSGALVARLDWEPLTMLGLGASGYYGSSNQGELPDGAGKLLLGEVDARFEHRGFQARGELAMLHVSGTELLPAPDGTPVGSLQYGLYAEAGYDLLHALRPGSLARLVVYGQYQRVDTNYEVAPVFAAADALEQQVLEAGLTWRPIPELVGKLDVKRTMHPLVEGQDLTWLDLGIGWMF